MGSAWTLFRVGGVSQALDGLRAGWIPLGKSLGQLATQSQAYQRELERSIGYSQWKVSSAASGEEGAVPSRFSVPRWLADSIRDEIRNTRAQLEKLQASELSEVRAQFDSAISKVEAGLDKVEQRSDLLSSALSTGNLDRASEEYPNWNRDLLAWVQG
ncbi:hypothetical protein EBZ37_11365, partial [bacterium]|nr:hypothetical protein [bacterium]